jgi:hypothetical protein
LLLALNLDPGDEPFGSVPEEQIKNRFIQEGSDVRFVFEDVSVARWPGVSLTCACHPS